jgi:uncharacterized protein (TIGR02118 family)
MFCASVVCPIQQGGTFDFDYFAHTHAPLFARLLGENCVRFEVHKSLASPGAPTPYFFGIAYFWVRSGEDFEATLAQCCNEIYADFLRFTDTEPLRQWSEIVQTGANS